MHKTMDYVCKEIEEIERKIDEDGEIQKSDVEYLDTLWHLKKDMLTAQAMEDSGYSHDDGYSRGGSYRGSYRDSSYGDESYADEGSYRDDRSMARGRMNAPRDSIGRYSGSNGFSRKGETEEIIEDLKAVMRELPTGARTKVERVVKMYDNAH